MRFLVPLFLLSSVCALAQAPVGDQTPPPPPVENPADVTNPSTVTSLAGQFFQRNYFNIYAFALANHDSAAPVYNSGTGAGSWGYSVGGGIDLFHQFEGSTLSLGYRGNYTDYTTSAFGSGTNQNLIFSYTKRLGHRWYLSVGTNAGISLYGGRYYNTGSGGPVSPITNPFSPETRYLSSTLALSYQQTRRLTYSLQGSFFLTRYDYPGAIGTTGGFGAASVIYRLTRRTTIGGTYSHSGFYYQQNVGNSQVNSVFGTVSHTLTRSTRFTFSAGVAHANSKGTALLPVQIVVDGQTVIVYERLAYNQSSWVPDFQGSIYHSLGRFEVSLAGGQTVSPGNGFFLASRELFLTGHISRTWRNSNVSAGGGYIHIVSVSNTIAGSYSSATFTASYGYKINRFLSAQAGYNYYKNGSIQNFGGVSDNRIFLGVTFSSKGIPLTLF